MSEMVTKYNFKNSSPVYIQELKDTKTRKSKDRQHNDQAKKDKQCSTINTQKNKDRATRTTTENQGVNTGAAEW